MSNCNIPVFNILSNINNWILSFVRPLIPMKLSQGKVKDSSCTSRATNVFDSLTITGRETRQVNKLPCCP